METTGLGDMITGDILFSRSILWGPQQLPLIGAGQPSRVVTTQMLSSEAGNPEPLPGIASDSLRSGDK